MAGIRSASSAGARCLRRRLPARLARTPPSCVTARPSSASSTSSRSAHSTSPSRVPPSFGLNAALHRRDQRDPLLRDQPRPSSALGGAEAGLGSAALGNRERSSLDLRCGAERGRSPTLRQEPAGHRSRRLAARPRLRRAGDLEGAPTSTRHLRNSPHRRQQRRRVPNGPPRSTQRGRRSASGRSRIKPERAEPGTTLPKRGDLCSHGVSLRWAGTTVHAGVRNRAITRLSPMLSKRTVSFAFGPEPSTSTTVPSPNCWWVTRRPRMSDESSKSLVCA